MAQSLLTAESVTVRFDGIVAVDAVSFALDEGELLGLIGPNGAGKTTLLRAIVGVVQPAEGRIALAGRDITALDIDRRARLGLALTHQIVRPFRSMTVLDNVALAAGHAKTASVLKAMGVVSRAPEEKRARELLELVGIANYAESPANVLPLGALKRLEVARALAIDPKVLLLDEPLAGLNHVEADRLAETLKDLNRAGVTMILIEHNLGQVSQVCPRLVVLDNGHKIADGETRAVLSDPTVVAAYVGREAANA